MAHETSVLLIFEHDLLGEGLAARLAAMGVDTLMAKSGDEDSIVAALETHPHVVVVECHREGCIARIRSLSSTSRVVDATGSVGRGYPSEAIRFDIILDALRGDPFVEDPGST